MSHELGAKVAMERFVAALGEVDGKRMAALVTPDALAASEERMPEANGPADALEEILGPIGPVLGRSVVDRVVVDGDVARVTLTHPELPGRDTYTMRLVDGRWLLDLLVEPDEEPG